MSGRRDVQALERIAETLEALQERELGSERALRETRRDLDRMRRARTDLDPLRTLPPRKLGWPAFLTAIPGLAALFRPLPPGYAEREGNIFTISCPCGQRPTVEVEHAAICSCDRFFLASEQVYVATDVNPSDRAVH